MVSVYTEFCVTQHKAFLKLDRQLPVKVIESS